MPNFVIPDHEVRELVNRLRDLAVQFHDHQSLRERIVHEVQDALVDKGQLPTEVRLTLVEARLTLEGLWTRHVGGRLNIDSACPSFVTTAQDTLKNIKKILAEYPLK